MAFAEIEKFIDTPVKHYSSGMYVRLAFAVAAHRSTGGSAGSPCSPRRRLGPEILLVDEVLMVGDAAFHQKKCLGMEHERIAYGYPIERRKH